MSRNVNMYITNVVVQKNLRAITDENMYNKHSTFARKTTLFYRKLKWCMSRIRQCQCFIKVTSKLSNDQVLYFFVSCFSLHTFKHYIPCDNRGQSERHEKNSDFPFTQKQMSKWIEKIKGSRLSWFVFVKNYF